MLRITAHSAEVLDELHKRYPMALVSNFYGNIACVLREFGLEKFFLDIVESAVVGIRKPDPKIFTLGVEALNQHPTPITQHLSPNTHLPPSWGERGGPSPRRKSSSSATAFIKTFYQPKKQVAKQRGSRARVGLTKLSMKQFPI